MKKLMILAAVMCAAVVSQAAMADWSLAGSGSSQKTKVVYIFDSADRTAILSILEAAATTGTASGTAKEIIQNASWMDAVKDTKQTDTAPAASGRINIPGDATAATSYFAVLFNKSETQGVENATRFYVSADATGHSYTDLSPSDGEVARMSLEGVSYTAIKTAAIPEPTSGLLLLLGVAGLALKRKHA